MTSSEVHQIKYDIEKEKIYEVDNFFDRPFELHDYFFKKNTNYVSDNFVAQIGNTDPDDPGLRHKLNTENAVDAAIIEEIVYKIQKVTGKKVTHISASFNVNFVHSMHGCIHFDDAEENVKKYSGLIYMSAVFPSNCGTTLYHYRDLNDVLNSKNITIHEYLSMTHVINNIHISYKNFVKMQCSAEVKKIMSEFKEFKKFQFAFNKFIAYPAILLHSQDDYFSDAPENSDSGHRYSFSVFFELDDADVDANLKEENA